MPGELILIVEDNPNNLKLMRDVLRFRGYTTLEAETGEAGVTLALARQPALILMDVQLPGMDGSTAMKALKANPSTQRIPWPKGLMAICQNPSLLEKSPKWLRVICKDKCNAHTGNPVCTQDDPRGTANGRSTGEDPCRR
jgi:CheY-like chemotaxis protein